MNGRIGWWIASCALPLALGSHGTARAADEIAFRRDPVFAQSGEKAGRVSAPASFVSEAALDENRHVRIGSLTRTALFGYCREAACQAALAVKCVRDAVPADFNEALLDRARREGADLVVLHEDRAARVSDAPRSTNECKARQWRRIGILAPDKRGMLEQRMSWENVCVEWATVEGIECRVSSFVEIWRTDAEMARRRLAALAREKTYFAMKSVFLARQRANRVADLVSVKMQGRYGFKNAKGEMVIPPQFTDLVGLSEGLIGVAVGEKEERRWGFIDTTGAWVIEPRYKAVGIFSEGLANVRLDDGEGYVDRKGRLVLKVVAKNAGNFHDGRAWVLIDGRFGYIDKQGALVIAARFEAASRFSEGLADVRSNGKTGYIDTEGRFVIQPQFDYASVFEEGVAQIRMGSKWGYINKAGEVFFDP